MAKVGSKGDVTVRVGTLYDDAGVEAGKGDLGDLDEKSTSTSEKMINQWEKVKANWLKVVAAIFAMKQAWDFADAAARFDQQEQAFTNLAASHGVNAKMVIADLKVMSGQMVSTAQLMTSAGSAMLLGIPADRLSEMMEIARAAAKVMGTSVQDAFNDIATGIGRQSPLILDNLGITIKLEKAYGSYASQLGKTTSQLTDSEKKQAFLNAAMDAGQEIVQRVGKQSLNAAQAMAMFTATMADMKIWAGKVIISTTAALAGVAFAISKVFAQMLKTAATAIGKLDQLLGKLPFYKATPSILEFAEAQGEAVKEADRLMNQSFGVATAVWKEKEAVAGLIQKKKELNQIPSEPIEEKKKEAEADDPETAAIKTRMAFRYAEMEQLMTFDEVRAASMERGAMLSDEMVGREVANNRAMAMAVQARSRVTGVANQEMEKQILSFIETGKFSLGAMAKIMAQQVKIELAGIAAKAAVQALYFTGLGLAASTPWGAASLGPPGQFFAAAAQMAAISGAALAATAAVQGLAGGRAEKPAPGTAGGEPIQTTGGDQAASVFESGSQPQQPTVIQRTYINVEGHVVDLADFARRLIPATEEALEDGA